MDAQVILALAIASPIILLPALFIWYMNAGGVFSAFKKAMERRVRQNSLSEEVDIDEK
jgi:hypothetical protein